MPYALSGKTRIYWESHGAGEPIVMIMGLSFPLDMWHRVLPAIQDKYRAIVLDNRGVGRSDVPRGPYKISRMAKDVVAVMDAAGIGRAHILGASMGGMIAQELALRFPERVISLILGCTSCGVLRAKRPDLKKFPGFRGWGKMTAEQRARAVIPLLYSPTTTRARIEEDIAVRLKNYPSTKGVLNQAVGMLLWKSYRRLPRLRMPVLIMHGDQDRVLPVENAYRIASRISQSKLVIVPGVGHVMTTDRPEFCVDTMLSFLEQTTPHP